MKISKDEVRHVAGLARLKIDDADLERFAGQLGVVLEYIESLETLDTEGIVPTAHAVLTKNAFREDEETGSLDRDSALAGAPESEDGFFVVPKIIE